MSSNSIYPYVYKIVDKLTGEFYIGSRQANVRFNRSPEEDFLIHYFTSSKEVEPRLRENPSNFECSIIFRSGEPEAAYWYEQLLIRENIKNPLCMNGYYVDPDKGKATFSRVGPSHTKGTTLSNEHKQKISKSRKGKIGGSRKGKSIGEEHKRKIGESLKGKVHAFQTCPHCGQIGGSNIMKRWHFDSCKYR